MIAFDTAETDSYPKKESRQTGLRETGPQIPIQ
jgi:hypothetical protein